MERLNMNVICDIVYRLRQGQSERGIERDLGHSRHTIGRYRRLAEEKGYLNPEVPLPEPEELHKELGELPRPPVMESTVAPYREVVEGLLQQGVEKATIYRRLRKNHGYRGSYSAVKRYVRHLCPEAKEVVVRIERSPGEEAQADFGGAGKQCDRKRGQWRQAYCFVMTLSYSRHQYAEIVFDQRMETWVQCHRRAFEFFGGVPREVTIDNLKAAILRASLDDPVLSVPYQRLAQHYGFLVHPCRVRKPEHKGKVENGVHYVKRSFLAGETFLDVEEANGRLREWIREEAGLREHGTTREAPLKRFFETERAALLPLPETSYELMEICRPTVHRDGYVQVDGCYYHVPYEKVGAKLDVYVHERTVEVYDGIRLLVTHARGTRKGQRISREEFYPQEKSLYLLRTRDYCQKLARKVGPHCAEVVERLLSDRPLDRLRSVQGLLRLADKHGEQRVEAACRRALYYGDASYVRVKKILAAGVEQQPLEGERQQRTLPLYEYARGSEEFFPDAVESFDSPGLAAVQPCGAAALRNSGEEEALALC